MEEARKDVPVVLLTVGDDTTKIGEPVEATKPHDPRQIREVVTRFSQQYVLSLFDPIIAPREATRVFLTVDRARILTHADREVVTIEFEISLDGGATWGGTYTAQKKCYSLAFGMTTGGLNGVVLPEGMSSDAVRWSELPPDLGLGRLIRPAVGAKESVELGIKVTFT